MRVRADGEDDFSGAEPDEMGGGLFAETGVGAGDEDGLGGEGGGGWWGFVDDLREEVAPNAHVVVVVVVVTEGIFASLGFLGGWGWN